MLDGDVDATRWSAEGFPQSADIDLGKDYDLSSIEIYPMGNRAYQYTIEASTDGTNYVQIVDRSSNTEGVQVISDAVSTTARYIKLEVTGASGYTGTWVSLNELKVFGLSNIQNIPVTGVSLLQTSVSLEVAQTIDLTETVSPSNASNQSVTWSSDNPSVATVNATGLVNAISTGTATITVTTNDGGFTADCDVTVNGIGTITGFTETCGTGTASTIDSYSGWDNAGSITYTGYNNNPGFNRVEATTPSSGYTGASGGSYVVIAPGYTETAWFIIEGINTLGLTDVELNFGIYYQSATARHYFEVSYSTDGTNWTVVPNSNSFPGALTWGIMTYTGLPAVSNLRIKFEELYRKSICFDDITVNGTALSIPVTGVTVSPATLSLDEGETSDLAESVSPSSATDKSVTWSSSNTSIATVDANGLVSAISAGNCTITVSTNDGAFTANCDVIVTRNGGLIETCGIGTSSTINAYSGWDNAGSITYTGYNTNPGFNKVDVATPSSGYTGASGGSYVAIAPGYTETAWFIIDGINTLGMTDVELSFGIYYKSATAHHYLEVSYSTDGANWSVVQNSNSFPGINTWGLMTYTGLPAVSNLKIKFEELYRKSVYFDDIIVTENSGIPSKSNSFNKTGVSKFDNSPEIKIIPNPVPENGKLSVNLVNFKAEDVILLKISDFTGKTIYIQDNIQIDLDGKKCLRLDANISKGIYIISANNGKCIKNNKLIVN